MKSVRFAVDGRTVAVANKGTSGIFAATWQKSAAVSHGKHSLTATAVDSGGKTGSAQRIVVGCG